MGEDGDKSSSSSSSVVPAAPSALKASSAPKTGVTFTNGVDKQEVPAAQGDSTSQDGVEGEAGEGDEASKARNPFDQYYAQLTHQQNMLQDSVRVSAYQRAIIENSADFKVRLLTALYVGLPTH